MNTTKQRKATFELYSRLPDAFGTKKVCVQDWLINNGETYLHTATVLASSVEEAYTTLQEKRTGHGRKARFATIHLPQHLPLLGSGDVLLEGEQAWMILSNETCEPIPYAMSHPWRSYGPSNQIYSVTWSPDGASLAGGDSGSEVRLHLLRSGKKKPWSTASYHRHNNWTVYAVAWSPDGTHIASGGYDQEVHIWRPDPHAGYGKAAKGSLLICRGEAFLDSKIRCLVWTSASSSVFAGRSDGCIVQWHAVTGNLLLHTKRHDHEIRDLALSPNDDQILASASEDATVRICRLSDPSEGDIVYRGHTHEALTVAWSPDGSQVVSGGKQDRHLHVWNPHTGDVQWRLPLSISFPEPFSINSVAWSPTGRLIAAGCADGTLQIVDVEQMRHLFTYRTENRNGINSVAWSPDGWVIATGGYHRWGSTHTVDVWQAGLDMVLLEAEGRDGRDQTVGERSPAVF